jgi:Na+:H+ antiporter, NhaA family
MTHSIDKSTPISSEASSGIVLLATAAVALAWANSPWRESYAALWRTPFGIRLDAFTFERDLHFWINDGVMTAFFFVVGLEIRRELHDGVLSDARRAALPLAAALGGMLFPACIFAAVNHGHASIAGWGIPMATDIAFAVGVLALLGSRVPPALRILLLALAVIDDVGAIVVIAIFYSAGIEPSGFGIHPALAGVALGLMIPARVGVGRAASPAERIHRALQGWVAFGAMPLFALANAGVSLGDAKFSGESLLVFSGVGVGLVIGKPLGILCFSWLATKLGLAALPRGVTWPQVGVVGVVAGIGFTMSTFIATLAFPVGTNLETSKVAILFGSGVAAVLGYALGRVTLPTTLRRGGRLQNCAGGIPVARLKRR